MYQLVASENELEAGPFFVAGLLKLGSLLFHLLYTRLIVLSLKILSDFFKYILNVFPCLLKQSAKRIQAMEV